MADQRSGLIAALLTHSHISKMLLLSAQKGQKLVRTAAAHVGMAEHGEPRLPVLVEPGSHAPKRQRRCQYNCLSWIHKEVKLWLENPDMDGIARHALQRSVKQLTTMPLELVLRLSIILHKSGSLHLWYRQAVRGEYPEEVWLAAAAAVQALDGDLPVDASAAQRRARASSQKAEARRD